MAIRWKKLDRWPSSLWAVGVTAWLGLGASYAASVEPAASVASLSQDEALRGAPGDRVAKSETRAAVGAAIRGKITHEDGLPLPGAEVVATNLLDDRETLTLSRADGTYSFESLPIALYFLSAQAAGFDIDWQTHLVLEPGKVRQIDLTARPFSPAGSLGSGSPAQRSPRQLFDGSDLVLTAVVGPSVVVERKDDGRKRIAKVATELRIETLLKGGAPGGSVTFFHWMCPKTGADDETPPGFAPGTRILAYLDASADSAGRTEGPAFESADAVAGIERLGPAELAAYVERLKALADLDRKAEWSGAPDPSEIMEWLVVAAENPPTRDMATAEIKGAFEAIEDFAATQGKTPEIAAQALRTAVATFRQEGGTVHRSDRPLLLGASLTESQKKRLTAALQATKSLRLDDLLLSGIAWKWDEKAAAIWLARQLRTVEPLPEDDELVTENLYDLAEQLDDGALRALVQAEHDRARNIYILAGDDCTGPARKLRDEKLAASNKKLRHQFGEATARRYGARRS